MSRDAFSKRGSQECNEAGHSSGKIVAGSELSQGFWSCPAHDDYGRARVDRPTPQPGIRGLCDSAAVGTRRDASEPAAHAREQQVSTLSAGLPILPKQQLPVETFSSLPLPGMGNIEALPASSERRGRRTGAGVWGWQLERAYSAHSCLIPAVAATPFSHHRLESCQRPSQEGCKRLLIVRTTNMRCCSAVYLFRVAGRNPNQPSVLASKQSAGAFSWLMDHKTFKASMTLPSSAPSQDDGGDTALRER